MSLTVPADLLDQARHGAVDDAAFAACIRVSLPYAWQLISVLTAQLHATGADHADNQVPPPDETARGQLLRLMA
ncbi:MAG TPA: SCO5389 family protein, partial [Streptosporangiaceae bacterium]|nr:SCO5389 family protein [Streptosporangiaceae bacterium]